MDEEKVTSEEMLMTADTLIDVAFAIEDIDFLLAEHLRKSAEFLRVLASDEDILGIMDMETYLLGEKDYDDGDEEENQ